MTSLFMLLAIIFLMVAAAVHRINRPKTLYKIVPYYMIGMASLCLAVALVSWRVT